MAKPQCMKNTRYAEDRVKDALRSSALMPVLLICDSILYPPTKVSKDVIAFEAHMEGTPAPVAYGPCIVHNSNQVGSTKQQRACGIDSQNVLLRRMEDGDQFAASNYICSAGTLS